MPRPAWLLIAFAFVLPACDGDRSTTLATTPGAPVTSSPGTPVVEPTSTPSIEPRSRPIPPAWAEPVEEDAAPDDLPADSLVPPGAVLTDRVSLPAAGDLPDQVVVSYVLGDDPFEAEHGVVVWERFAEAPAWSVVLALSTDPTEGVLGIGLQTGDLTGDLHHDVLAFEDTGGTGGCGRWRVLAASASGTDVVFDEQTCDTEVQIAGPTLSVREAVFGPNDAHCCPRAYRISTLEWDGESFAVTDVHRERA